MGFAVFTRTRNKKTLPWLRTARTALGWSRAFPARKSSLGLSEFEDIRELTAGRTSALVFRIIVRGNPYLLRLIMRTDALGGPTHQFACMKAFAGAGIAPQMRKLLRNNRGESWIRAM